MTDIMKDFYSDGKAHANQELYELFADLVGYDDYERRNHVLRGMQQRLKKEGFLINVSRGMWKMS